MWKSSYHVRRRYHRNDNMKNESIGVAEYTASYNAGSWGTQGKVTSKKTPHA